MASHGRQSVVEARLLNGTILIYGATGYTGKLIAKAASDRGARPILAGRNLDKVKRVAEPLGLSARAFDLGDPARIDAAIKDVSVVLCAAGPFSATSRPVADACLRNRVHYLDITGEIDVFEALAARDAEAKARGVMLLPGVGFDVVPSDCLAAHLKRRLPDANDLKLYLSLRRKHVSWHGQNHDRGNCGWHAHAAQGPNCLSRSRGGWGHAISERVRSRPSRSVGATSRLRSIRPAFPISTSISRRPQRSERLRVRLGSSSHSSGWTPCKASSSPRLIGCRRGQARQIGEPDKLCWLARRATTKVRRFALG